MSNILLGLGIVLMFIIIALLADARSRSKRKLEELTKANETTQLVIVTINLIQTELVQVVARIVAALDTLASEVQTASECLAAAIRDARRHDEAVAMYQRAMDLREIL
jgi:ABC-type tungstate transport system substrate-binding protein